MYGSKKENLANRPMNFTASENLSGVKLTDLKYGKTDRNFQFIEITLSKGGAETSFKKFEVNTNMISPRSKKDGTVESKDEAISREISTFNTYMYDLAIAVGVPIEVLDGVSGGDFRTWAEDFCRKVIANVDPEHSITVKLPVNKAGYVSLPNYGPWVKKDGLEYPVLSFSANEKKYWDMKFGDKQVNDSEVDSYESLPSSTLTTDSLL